MENLDHMEGAPNEDKIYREMVKQEIIGKVTNRINSNDPNVLKAIKGLLDKSKNNNQDNKNKKK